MDREELRERARIEAQAQSLGSLHDSDGCTLPEVLEAIPALLDELAAREHDLDVAKAALIHIHQFIDSELDPEPGYWADYYGDPEMQHLVSALAVLDSEETQ